MIVAKHAVGSEVDVDAIPVHHRRGRSMAIGFVNFLQRHLGRLPLPGKFAGGFLVSERNQSVFLHAGQENTLIGEHW